jgi:hypothetical protein
MVGGVWGGRVLRCAGEAVAPRQTGSVGAGGEGAPAAAGVDVYEVDFVKPGEAVVAYRLRGGTLETGTAVGGSAAAGRWLVSQATFCADAALTDVRCR